ncbi:expressed unknown protein [Seminavis robusta]|uniref:Uncharacterized protein n=1 Tax=Seminavis robusta TaxID=568900 RepID=A0A9N8H4E5_9STRA|nr:expressed unknown protein [Seminavis robusta]|eukprot:Sro60_g034750.1 n/a (117) ;mRNA; f:93633-93983
MSIVTLIAIDDDPIAFANPDFIRVPRQSIKYFSLSAPRDVRQQFERRATEFERRLTIEWQGNAGRLSHRVDLHEMVSWVEFGRLQHVNCYEDSAGNIRKLHHTFVFLPSSGSFGII